MLKYVWNSLAKTKYINWSQAYALIKDIIDINKHALKNNTDKSGSVNINFVECFNFHW